MPHNYTIEIIEGKQPPYGPIFLLSAAKLDLLRRYLRVNLALGRIRPSMSLVGVLFTFVPKKEGDNRMCINYRGLNAITIKNRDLLPLITELIDCLAGAKIFTQLDLRDAYYRIRIRKGDK